MSDPHPILWRVLKNLDKLDVLTEGEIICEQELATLGTDPGALIVTNVRLLFVTTTLRGRKKNVLSVPLEEIAATTTATGRFPRKDNGVLRIGRHAEDAKTEVVLERIPGGEERADEIAQTIARQKRVLEQVDYRLGEHSEAGRR
jgi:hypothetical protein